MREEKNQIENKDNMNIQKLKIPLSNFDRDKSSVLDVGSSRIIPATEASFPIEVSDFKYILEMDSRKGEEPRRTLDRVLTVFKLFKDSLVLSKIVFIGTNDKDFLPHYTHWKDQDRGLPLYHLSEDEETEFIKFWNKYFEINPTNFAVSRFHLADYRAYSTDRFVDYVESLEYLFVPDSGEGEIAYKFRSRGSLILGRNELPDMRKVIFNNLKNAYNLRSAIVHGDNINKLMKGRTWEDNIKPIRCYARDAIKFFFRAGCLDNTNARKELIERYLIFEAKIQTIT